MKIKKLITIIILFFLTIQINITSCSDSTGSNETGEDYTTTVKDPTNDYEVVVEVISFGGLGGCTVAAIKLMDEPVIDAEFTVNNVTLVTDTTSILNNLYSDEMYELSYLPGTNYSLNVLHMGSVIATGTSIMPSTPVFTNLKTIQHHNLNTDLQVSWKKIYNASSLSLSITGYVYDPSRQDSVSREFDTGTISPATTSFTIPDTFFTIPGEYTMGIVAYHGINPGEDADVIITDSGYLKSYNMDGAAGVFLAANGSSEEGAVITVGNLSLLKKSDRVSVRKYTYKEILLQKHKKFFANKLNKRSIQ